MSLKGNTVEEKIWNYLVEKGLSKYGVAGLMGNLRAESGLDPHNLENLCEKRLKEAGKPYCTDDTYTAAVDSGRISREEFLHPLPGKQYGYGLAQWTTAGRKAGLYDLAKSKGVSIGDLEMQLEFLIKELSTGFKAVYEVLKSAKSVKAASDKVLTGFECPADQGDAVKAKRASYGESYYEKYAGQVKTPQNGGNIMGIIIGSARIGANGRATGDAPGDQKQVSSTNDTVGEVSMQPMYVHSKGWYITRPKSVEHANAIAEKMVKACNNANIGYDQDGRYGVITNGTGSKVKTECDCSSLVRACVKEATGKDPGDFNTANEVSKLEATGLFEKKIAYVSQEKTPVYNGDILTTTVKGHTAIVVGGNQRTSAGGYYPKYTGSSGSIVVALAAVGEADTSKQNRAKIAAANGIVNYAYTADQNTQMVKLLKSGKLKKA